jgi:type III secretory pathway component EscS
MAYAQPALPSSQEKGSIKIESSVLRMAKQGDVQATAMMFKQFVPEDEGVYFAEYLGVEGFWGMGTHSFGCLTDKRVASIRVGAFGEVVYQDGYIDYVNSGVVYQPSKLMLYVAIIVCTLVALASAVGIVVGIVQGLPVIIANCTLWFLVSLIALPVSVKVFYRLKKCGVVFWIREGICVYLFTNRGWLLKANRLYRNLTQLREQRITTAPR